MLSKKSSAGVKFISSECDKILHKSHLKTTLGLEMKVKRLTWQQMHEQFETKSLATGLHVIFSI